LEKKKAAHLMDRSLRLLARSLKGN